MASQIATKGEDYAVAMSASATLAYALIAESDRDPLVVALVVALISAVVAVFTTMMSNASANRRQRLELRSRKGHSGTVGLLWVAIAILSAGILYVATRPDEATEVASAGPAPSSTLPAATTPTTIPAPVPTAAPTPIAPTTIATTAAPACAAFTVQISAPLVGSDMAGIEAQATLLAQKLPELGQLHSAASEPCGVAGRTQFYFGPFADGDAARAACFGIGQELHDNVNTYTEFHGGPGVIEYPYYRVVDGISVKGADGKTLPCNPDLNQ